MAINKTIPVTNEEKYLSKLAGDEVVLPNPVSKTDKYMAKIAGEDIDVPNPVSREDYYLSRIKMGEESESESEYEIYKCHLNLETDIEIQPIYVPDIQELNGSLYTVPVYANSIDRDFNFLAKDGTARIVLMYELGTDFDVAFSSTGSGAYVQGESIELGSGNDTVIMHSLVLIVQQDNASTHVTITAKTPIK